MWVWSGVLEVLCPEVMWDGDDLCRKGGEVSQSRIDVDSPQLEVKAAAMCTFEIRGTAKISDKVRMAG